VKKHKVHTKFFTELNLTYATTSIFIRETQILKVKCIKGDSKVLYMVILSACLTKADKPSRGGQAGWLYPVLASVIYC
jgi:hypothetical protein